MSKYMGFRKKEWLFLLRWTVETAVGCTVVSPFITSAMFFLAFSTDGLLGVWSKVVVSG